VDLEKQEEQKEEKNQYLDVSKKQYLFTGIPANLVGTK
jgi:hypothetical protein